MLKKIYKLGLITLMKEYKIRQFEKHPLLDLFWECTMSCNAKCKHCGSSALSRKYEDELTTEEIKNAFKSISESMDASTILINVTGGEPLVRKDIFEVMEYATSLGFRWGMTTNGILLNDENIEKLKKSNMEVISVSIDGLEKTHDAFRGVEGSYKTIVGNIERLKNANFLKHIQVTTVFHKDNIDELEEMYEKFSTMGINSWRLMSMDPIGRAKENEELLLDGKELRRLLDFIKYKNKKGKLELMYGCPGFLGLEYEGEVRRAIFNCRTGVSVGSILYNGDIYVCPNVPRIKSLVQGNVRYDNFADVWNNKFEYFRDANRMSCKECKECENWDICLGGAMHTWNFEEKRQNKCPYNMLYKEDVYEKE